MIEEDLSDSEYTSKVSNLARVRTLTVLEQLDPSRKTQAMQFLLEAQLVQAETGGNAKGEMVVRSPPIILLSRANLSGADLSSTFTNVPEGVRGGGYFTDLMGADLNFADLSGADLSFAQLDHASLIGADLSCADLRHTSLSEADLTGANLRHAKGIKERSNYLGRQSFSLGGATMPNGQKYEDWLKDKKDLGENVKECSPS